MTCTHFLALAIAIQNERDPARRMQLLRDLPEPARDPVLAWLWADVRSTENAARRDMASALQEAANDG